MDEREWNDRPLGQSETMVCGQCTVRLRNVPAATLMSGNITAAYHALAPNVPILGLAGRATSRPFAIRIGRDHALLVSDMHLGLTDGWHEHGFALTRAEDRFQALAIDGPDARGILAQGTAVDIEAGSPSAAIRFAEIPALLTKDDYSYLLWIERGNLTYVTSFLRAARPSVGPVTG